MNEIYEVFYECGDIDSVEIRNREVRRRTHVFLQFLTKGAASSAHRMCNVIKIRNRRVVVFELRVERFGGGDVYRNDIHKFQEKLCGKKDNEKQMTRCLQKIAQTNLKRAMEEIVSSVNNLPSYKLLFFK